MQLNCQICGAENVPQNHFYEIHKIPIRKYLNQYFPKKDLLTNEDLPWTGNFDSYILNDFKERQNLKIYLNRLEPQIARKYVLEKFKQRKEIKNLIYALSQFELRSLMLPPVNYIETKLFGYDSLIKEVGLKSRFNYEEKMKYNNNENLEMIIDTREQLRYNFNKSKTEKLEYGDYAAVNNPNKIFIERKGLNDALSTFTAHFDRFCRELDRVVEDNAYLVILIESSYNNLLTFDTWEIYRKTKVNPAYFFHKIREINQKYPLHCQFVCSNDRENAQKLVEKIFLMDNNVRNIDLEYMVDLNII